MTGIQLFRWVKVWFEWRQNCQIGILSVLCVNMLLILRIPLRTLLDGGDPKKSSLRTLIKIRHNYTHLHLHFPCGHSHCVAKIPSFPVETCHVNYIVYSLFSVYLFYENKDVYYKTCCNVSVDQWLEHFVNFCLIPREHADIYSLNAL